MATPSSGFGCAILVDAFTIAYAIEGQVTRTATISDFQSIARECVWWTTIPSINWRQMGFPATAWRDANFIEPGLVHIAEEAGCRGLDIPIFMSRLVSRIARIVAERFGVDLKESKSLTEGLQHALVKDSAIVEMAAPPHLKPWHQCSYPTLLQVADSPAECGLSARIVRQHFQFPDNAGRCKRFGIARNAALENLLGQHVPAMNSEWVHDEVMSQATWHALLLGHLTGIVKVRILGVAASTECQSLLPVRRRRLGVPAFDIREMANEFWVSSLEALMLASSCDVVAIEAWIATNTIPVGDLLSQRVDMYERDHLSFSADILWENLVCAITRIRVPDGPLRPTLEGKGRGGDEQGWPPHTAWLNASLRAETLTMGMRLAQKGIRIMAHDTTGIWVAAEHRDDCEMADEQCAEAGLVCGNDAWAPL